MEYRQLNRKGVELSKEQLEQYLEKLAAEQILQNSSDTNTFPIPKLKENFKFIEDVYDLLNSHVKMNIPIHPAGEWLLDNFYIIEETVKVIIQNMPLNKYKKLMGIANNIDKGFARIYVLAYDIINYTGNSIDYKNVSDFLKAYQMKKTLSMDEIWNIGIFMQIAIIQKIKDICEQIYYSQIQKVKAENIFDKYINNKEYTKIRNNIEYRFKIKEYKQMRYSFIEHLSYKLKNEGKKAIPFFMALEEQVNKMGTSIDEVVKKEHYDIALKKVAMANCITSMKELTRMDFLSIFEETNEVEEVLNQDPVKVYSNMDYKTKEYYRNTIEEISKKTKIAEIYIAKKALELAKDNFNNEEINKEGHIGYYLVDEGKYKLYKVLQQKVSNSLKKETKVKLYIGAIWTISFLIDLIFMISSYIQIKNIILTIIIGILLIFPIEEISLKIIQYILLKIVKPKLIPKMDFYNGISEENSCFVVIPTILNSKEKVKELIQKLEVYYLANKSDNLYFALLGDCTSGPNKEENFDKDVIEEGRKQVQILNEKYKKNESDVPKFYFTYRKRYWNGNEECYLGWERKRGLLSQFNRYILGKEDNPFFINTIENTMPNEVKQKIKYVITLDADTELVLNTGLELIGSMAHILNKPVLNKKKDLVIDGYALIQPRIGINLDAANKNLFTKIFAGTGGIDNYTNAISDIYQDNFGEGIYTGKGIYDLKIFSEILDKEIPDNTVLSHDLLEGSYLRCGLASDIVLMDGYPSSYISYKKRLHRWIRGDFQILIWACKKIINKKEQKKENPLNNLSRYKIIDNMIRELVPIFTLLTFILICTLKIFLNIKIIPVLLLLLLSITISTILDLIDNIVFKKEGQRFQRTFNKRFSSWFGSVIRGIIRICDLPDKVHYSLDAIIRTLYRMFSSKKHLLEWTTSEDTEKNIKNDVISFYKNMIFNVTLGCVLTIYTLFFITSNPLYFILLILAFLWIITPFILYFISKNNKNKNLVVSLTKEERDYLYEIGKKTWQYFKDSLTDENNYLPPDNYQEDRKNKFVSRTSSTNIGLAILSIISSYDLKYENLEDTLKLLKNIINTIEKLPKWNGHLYNWYNIKTLEPLSPRYVSTVDNGNYIGYIYVLKEFYKNIKEEIKLNSDITNEEKEELLKLIPKWENKSINEIEIANCNFSELYDKKKGLFSIGFNVEENKLTDSYYDLLASEARQASIVAISKKDVPSKHWNKLSRTMTTMEGYNGLISWSGTAFEYLMPTVIMNEPEGSLINESIKFMLMSQKKYAKNLIVPWGFSESAYYLKDLNGNFQYKAIGLPWLGLKRGLEEDIVVSSYASFMALNEIPNDVIHNIKKLDNDGMYDKYGFYESIDYTPIRMPKNKKEMVVRTYMAHHQGLILLSINNFFNNNILKKRFSANPEIAATEILLQENVPEKRIITKEEKKKPIKITYHDYESYAIRTFNKINGNLPICNVISSDNYSIVTNVKGEGYSKYKNYYINKFINTSSETQGIFFYMKNTKNKRIWTTNNAPYLSKPDKYEISFSEDRTKIKRIDGQIETNLAITISPNAPLEIRNLKLKNNGIEDELLEITTVLEPILDTLENYVGHPAFNNLFLVYEYDRENNIFIIKRKDRKNPSNSLYLAVSLFTKEETFGELEFEIDKSKFQGRGNINLPVMVENSKPFSNKIDLSLNPILALRKTIAIKPKQEICFNLLICVSDNKEQAINNIKEYQNEEKIEKTFELAKAKADAEARYLNLTAKQIETYQKMLGYILFNNSIKNKLKDEKDYYPKEDLWKIGISGDLPILTIKIKDTNEQNVLNEVLKAYEFYKIKNIDIDLVIIDEESNSYEKYTKETIRNSILNANLAYMQNIKGGIFILDGNENTDIVEFYSKLIIDAKKGPLNRQLKDLEDDYLENIKQIGIRLPTKYEIVEEENSIKEKEELLYNNEYGGFSKDGKNYIINIDKDNRIPTVWSHIMANDKFGTIVTDSFGGYTWSKNSRLNKITSWNNNQVIDEPSEIIYIQDEETLKTYSSIGLNPMPDNKNYKITYGFGYANYEHESKNLNENLTTFIPNDDSLKVYMLNLKNKEPSRKKLNIIYYAKLVLGEDDLRNNKKIDIKFKDSSNIILLHNKVNTDFKQITYLSCSEKIRSFTGSYNFFVGNGNISNPEALRKVSLNNENSINDNEIIAYQIEIELEAYEDKNIIFVLGTEETQIGCQDKAYQYINKSKVEDELFRTKNKWEKELNKIQVNTPIESFNILMNGWLIYQTIVSRLNARTSFYQCGGAYGFRDQLQDTIALKYFNPDLMKKQILKHSKHQFEEGDVEHWWHEETSKGIRTRFSDDLLWLVYLTEEYILTTADYSILDEKTNYLHGEELSDGVDENYDRYESSNISESLYEHCKKAIQRGINIGRNGLCKIGSGDWNDGMSNVGNKGEGESVWLSFFVFDILQKWIPICIKKGESEDLINKYKEIVNELKKNVNSSGWDGRWFRRAFTDDGDILRKYSK